jgi:hypothetical protein
VLLLGVLLRRWANHRTPLKLNWIPTSLVAVLVDPHLVDYDLTVLIPAGVLAVTCAPSVRWWLVLLYILLVFRAQLPLVGDSAIQLSALVLFVCLGLVWQRPQMDAISGAGRCIPRASNRSALPPPQATQDETRTSSDTVKPELLAAR